MGNKKIRVHLVYDVKHDGCHKSRLVTYGHLTDIPVNFFNSGVIYLCNIRLLLFFADMNEIEACAEDTRITYLEADTLEKGYIIAGSKFGDREGCIITI